MVRLEWKDDGEGEEIVAHYCYERFIEGLWNPILAPLPIISDGPPIWDPTAAPSRPLACCHRGCMAYIAHSDGFYVVKLHGKSSGLASSLLFNLDFSIQQLFRANITVGRVSILAVSITDEWLAATVDQHVHLYGIKFLGSTSRPSFSFALDDIVKDLKWYPAGRYKHRNKYLALSMVGTLYDGEGSSTPRIVFSNVDAVEWGFDGKFFAVAQKNIITFFTLGFEEKTSISLSPISLIVDSITFICDYKILLGCFESGNGSDSNGSDYVIKVITSSFYEYIIESSSKPSIVTFHGRFEFDTDVSVGAIGPSLFVVCPYACNMAFLANRRSSANHIQILCWSEKEDGNTTFVELPDEAWQARIFTQENGNANMLLALDRIYEGHLLVVTLDGKLDIFDFHRISFNQAVKYVEENMLFGDACNCIIHRLANGMIIMDIGDEAYAHGCKCELLTLHLRRWNKELYDLCVMEMIDHRWGRGLGWDMEDEHEPHEQYCNCHMCSVIRLMLS